MTQLHPALEEQEWFSLPELQKLFGMSKPGIHHWHRVGKIRKYKRTSAKGRYLIPRHEVIRLLKLEDRSVPGLWTRPPRVLLIDDNAAIRRLVKERCAPVPLDLKTAASVATGLAIAKAFKPDVVILDYLYEKPTKQGPDPAIAFMAKVKKHGDPKVIGISARADAGPTMRAAGAVEFLVKPIKLEALKDLIFKVSSAERRRRRRERRVIQGVIGNMVAS